MQKSREFLITLIARRCRHIGNVLSLKVTLSSRAIPLTTYTVRHLVLYPSHLMSYTSRHVIYATGPYTYTRARTRTRPHGYMRICPHVYMRICPHAYMPTRVYAHMRICPHACVRAYMRVCMCICICICIYTSPVQYY